MSKLRIAFVSGLLLLLIGLHVFENLIDHEYWPVCLYPMYSWLETERAAISLRLVGVRPDGSETPFQSNAYMYPFDQSRMADVMLRMDKEQDARAREAVALSDVLRRYQRHLHSGQVSGPVLVALRLYRTKHELMPWAANLEHPEERLFLAESEKLP